MTRYASGTKVSANRSREEIEKLLLRFGAGQFGYLTDTDAGMAHIMFVYRKMRFRVSVTLPARAEFKLTQSGREKKDTQVVADLEKETRRRWRSLTLLVKAKLVAVQDDVASFEEEFLPYLLWGNGQTTAEHMRPKLAEMAASGVTPKLLPMPQ